MTVNWASFGYARAVALLPKLKLGKPTENAEQFIHLFKKETKAGASVLTTAELALTGYTCEDLFHSESLHQEYEEALLKILTASKGQTALWVVGAPLRLPDGRLLNGAYVFNDGKTLGFVPKVFLPNMGEFYERRWFVSGRAIQEEFEHPTLGKFLISPHQIFAGGSVRVGIEICHDLWAPHSPSADLASKGANLILNLSASNELVGKAAYRKKLVEVQSEKLHCAYLYTSSGMGESSKDTVFSGHTFAYELGNLIGESKPFQLGADVFAVEFDFEKILNARSKDVCFLESVEQVSALKVKTQSFSKNPLPLISLTHKIDSHPFLSEVGSFEEVLDIQAEGLLRRVESSFTKSVIIGVSGGLDSTHALHVALRTKRLSGFHLKVIGVTLPGPGTSEKTLNISRALLQEAGVDEVIEVSIGDAVEQHLKDLGKTITDRTIVFENAQARERTQILFDLANQHQGIVIGTGDLSELALGWCTFNADHMAHYAVNSGIPKTVVKRGVRYWSETAGNPALTQILNEILALPISPELLPPDESGNIAQETESVIGSYDLHDFFLYHFLNHGFAKEKVRALANVAFEKSPELKAGIDRAVEIFYDRFFSQQFKRTTLPPGPKVHGVSLSPRSDFRMPDEISARKNP